MFKDEKWVRSLITCAVFRRDLKSQDKQNGVPHTDNQNTPFTFKLIDWELQTRRCVTAERRLSWISKLAQHCWQLLWSLNLAACYLLMKAKHLPRVETCLGLSMNLFVSRLFVMVGFINTDLHLSEVIYSVSWMPEKQICLPSAGVKQAK